MINCKNCNYFYADGKIEWCAYYNHDIATIIIRSMCSWIEEEDDNRKNKDDEVTEQL